MKLSAKHSSSSLDNVSVPHSFKKKKKMGCKLAFINSPVHVRLTIQGLTYRGERKPFYGRGARRNLALGISTAKQRTGVDGCYGSGAAMAAWRGHT